MSSPKQNDVWKGVNSEVDLTNHIETIINHVSKETGFIVDKILSTSRYWSKEANMGAFHCNGTFKGHKTVLKIQGVKQETSEAFMIQEFERQNKSNLVRPPKLYFHIPWNENLGYEVLILEDVGNNLVVNSPTNKKELEDFFKNYKEYRSKCLNKPWLKKPKVKPEHVKLKFENWMSIGHKLFPNHPFRKDEDSELFKKAVDIFANDPEFLKVEFVHGHFSAIDLHKVDGQTVLLSNLYWSWKNRYYDLIFGYHWFIYSLSDLKGMTPEKIEEQRSLWLEQMLSITEDKKLLNLALLERATAGLILDSLSVEATLPISEYLVNKTRDEVKRLINNLA